MNEPVDLAAAPGPFLPPDRLRQSAVWLALGLVVLSMIALNPGQITPEQWPVLLRQAAPLGMLALGQTVLLIGRGFDLSVGGVVGFVSVFAAGPLAQTQAAGVIVLLCLAFGAAVGLVNGVIVAIGRVSPLVATLGTGFILTGAMLIYTGGAPSGAIPEGIRGLSRDRLLGVPMPIIIWLALALVVGVLLRHSWIGRYVYAVGASPAAARHAGVPVPLVQILSYVICSLCAAIGGLLLAGFVGIGTLGAGQELMLNSLAAAVIGGTLLSGGVGGVSGTVGGVILLTVLSALLTGIGAGAAGGSLVHGLVVLGASLLFRERRHG